MLVVKPKPAYRPSVFPSGRSRLLARVLCLTLLLGSCGKTTEFSLGSGPDSPDGSALDDAQVAPSDAESADRVAIVSFDDAFDIVDDFAEECRTVCSQKRPLSIDTCTTPPVEDCTDLCAIVLRNVDRECAECIINTLYWGEARRWCNDFECGCDDLANQPRFDITYCTNECEASLQYQRRLRENALRPEDIGRPPAESIDLQENSLTEIEPTPEGFFALSLEPAELVFLSFSGALQWRVELNGIFSSTSGLFSNGSRALVRPGSIDSVWFSSNLQGDSQIINLPESFQPVVNEDEQFIGLWSGEICVLSDKGELIPSEKLPESAMSIDGLIALRVGGYIAVSDGPASRSTSLVKLQTDEGTDALSIAWQIDIQANVTSLAEISDGGLFFGGLIDSMLDKRPIYGVVSKQGELLWQWRDESSVTQSREPQVIVSGEGILYGVSNESPVFDYRSTGIFTPSPQEDFPFAGVCSVYGCWGMSVRSFDQNGSLRWEYQHRSTANHAFDAALVGQDLFILASLDEEQERQFLFRFEP
jgi:hypothetical protein